jgi:Fur family ferric uptake transcriptional regulator/Fur family zinc uptake transcriptional regulator
MDANMKFKEYAARLLKAAGLRVTINRVDILKFLMETGRPLSHSEIQDAMPSLDRVTLYRTLASFVSKEVAHQVQGPDGAWRFCAHEPLTEGCSGDHPHFLCYSCGKMFCLTEHKLPRVEVPEGFVVYGKQFVLYGKCAQCAEQRKRRLIRLNEI